MGAGGAAPGLGQQPDGGHEAEAEAVVEVEVEAEALQRRVRAVCISCQHGFTHFLFSNYLLAF